jgi:hypothetical protein
MFYGVINESVLQEGKILDFIKRIFKKKDYEVAPQGSKFIDSGVKIFDNAELQILVYPEDNNEKKIAAFKETCKKDAAIIDKEYDHIKEKGVKIFNKIIKRHGIKIDSEITTKDIFTSEHCYVGYYNKYMFRVECTKTLKQLPYNFASAEINVKKDGTINCSVYEVEEE